MCLAIPGKIVSLTDDRQALVDFMGARKVVSVELLEHCAEGDYVIVHAGFAINMLNREEALETIGFFKQLTGHSG